MKRSSVTIKDIARNLSISHTTVSRVLSPNSSSTISEQTRERVLAESLRLGYQPNRAARALVTGRTGLICLLLWTEGVQDDYHARVIHEAQAVMQESPFELCVVLASRRSFERNPLGPSLPLSVDGIILYEIAGLSPSLVEQYHGIPMVSAGAYNQFPGVDSVVIDLEKPTRDAMRQFINQGRKHILYLGAGAVVAKGAPGAEAYIAADVRHRVYDEMARTAGLTPTYIHTGRGKAEARRVLADYLGNHAIPDAIFCHSDEIAIGAYRALRDAGISIPTQTALIGCDGLEDTEYIEVPISTIVQPIDAVLRRAVEALLERMATPQAPLVQITIPAVFHARKSSDI